MSGHRVGYRRVSTAEQNLDRQDLPDIEKMFEDKASGGTADRPGLNECLSYLRTGDTLVVHSMDRMGRSIIDLVGIIRSLNDRGVGVQLVKENLHFHPDKDDPYSDLTLYILGAVAEFERAMIRERQREGIAKAKQRGNVYKGRAPALSPEEVRTIRQRSAEGATLVRLAKDYAVARSTIQNALAGTGTYSGEAYR